MHGEGWYSLADLLGKVEDDGRFALGFETLLQVGEASERGLKRATHLAHCQPRAQWGRGGRLTYR